MSANTDYNYTTIKYNTNGVQQWVTVYNGTGNSADYAYAMTAGVLGNVYVTGRSYGFSTYFDYATVKYNTNGEQQWVSRYSERQNYYDEATAITVDAFGNVYVAGRSWDSETGYDYATIMYNIDGVQVWTVRYNCSKNSTDIPVAISLDQVRNVYVAGKSEISNVSVYTTVKYFQNYLSFSVLKNWNIVSVPKIVYDR